jgi:peptidoglycan/xylan/chitin deacetylase (PgdA/CDA1 family)
MFLSRSLLICALLLGSSVVHSVADECKYPDAIGTSRTLSVKPTDFPLVGKVQYMETLRLQDHEIVLTFDDGPVEDGTDLILDELARQCVKVTFFMIGINAVEAPELAKRVYDEGHTVGFHTFSHPDVEAISFETAKGDINKGMSAVKDALGQGRHPAPFYRPPYLSMTKELERYLNSRGIMVWSIDVDSEDWTSSNDDEVLIRTLDRLEKAGKGILLMHDIQPVTVRVLPKLLVELQKRNFRIVHVIPAKDNLAKAAGVNSSP